MLKSKNEIQQWLKNNNISDYTINEDLTVDVYETVDLRSRNLTEIPIQFGIVKKDFNCYINKLESLKGCPVDVGGNFLCSGNRLTSLEHSPQSINGHFACGDNKLTNLKDGPKYVAENYVCEKNPLDNFEYLPLKVGGLFKHCGIKEQGIEPNTSLEELHKRNEIIKSKEILEIELNHKDLTKEEVRRPKMKI